MKIIVYTIGYNCEKTLAETIESVLKQTYEDFEYYIEDNGSEDGTREILLDYAKRDSRIIPRFRELNHTKTGELAPTFPFISDVAKEHDGFFTNLDADDWWEPDYLERLVSFAERNDLDIACTGTCMHVEGTEQKHFRKVKQPLVLSRGRFGKEFPFYHAFFRPIWGKLIRLDILQKLDIDQFPILNYGGDTQFCFQALRFASRIGVDSSVLHHYRIHQKSVSHQYDS